MTSTLHALLTISPALPKHLERTEDTLEKAIPGNRKGIRHEKGKMNDKKFRLSMNEDNMAYGRQAKRILEFMYDTINSEKLLEEKTEEQPTKLFIASSVFILSRDNSTVETG